MTRSIDDILEDYAHSLVDEEDEHHVGEWRSDRYKAELLAAFAVAQRKAVLAERERCVKIAEDMEAECEAACLKDYDQCESGAAGAAGQIADAIRAASA